MAAATEVHPTHRFPAAVVAGDLEAVTDAMAPEVVLISPITSRFRFEGRDQVRELFSVVLESFEDIKVFEEFGSGSRRVVAWRARVGGQQVEGTDILRLDEDGKVREIRLFIRPLPGLAAATATLGPRLRAPLQAARRGGGADGPTDRLSDSSGRGDRPAAGQAGGLSVPRRTAARARR